MSIENYGAFFTRAAKHDRDDARLELEKIQSRRRIRIGLEAADAFEHAMREGLVFVSFAAADDDCDPLDMALEFFVADDGWGDERLSPVFRFNLREAFLKGVKGYDWSVGNKYRVVADGLEALLVEMRAELEMFAKAEAEDRAEELKRERDKE
jgi:hypothetical protein